MNRRETKPVAVSPQEMSSGRIVVLFVLIAAAFVVLWARTFQIQIIQNSYYSLKAEMQSLTRVLREPERGKIWDSDNRLLALSVNAPDPKKTSFPFVRNFPYGSMASSVLGFVNREGKGTMGLEYHYDHELKGEAGWVYRKLDASRQVYFASDLDGQPPVPGVDLVLTLDKDIQEIVESTLAKGVRAAEADRGAAIVVDPKTGDVLAMASYPAFDPNNPSSVSLSNTKNEWVGRVFEPGSTFKIVTAAAVLEEKKMNPDDIIDAEGGEFKIGGGIIRDAHKMGRVTFTEAMANSSNIAFGKMALKMSPERFYRYIRMFGFGAPTGMQLPAEEKGRVKNIKNWSGRTQATMAMGHEVLTTPMQVVMAYAAIANDGVLLRPRLVKEIRDPRNHQNINQIPVKEIRRIISGETSSMLRQMLREVVLQGTAMNIKSDILDIAGKTGTAEKYSMETGSYLRGSINASFVGMVPASEPRYVCMVLIDEPRTAHSGAATAAPVFKEIMERIYLSPKVYNADVAFAQKHRSEWMPFYVENWIGLTREKIDLRSSNWPTPVKLSGNGKYVTRMSPSPGQIMPAGDTLRIVLGTPDIRIMPDLTGVSIGQAMQQLAGFGIRVHYQGRGYVKTQIPAPGETIEQGSQCFLELGEAI